MYRQHSQDTKINGKNLAETHMPQPFEACRPVDSNWALSITVKAK
jgi:hypothetical protein